MRKLSSWSSQKAGTEHFVILASGDVQAGLMTTLECVGRWISLQAASRQHGRLVHHGKRSTAAAGCKLTPSRSHCQGQSFLNCCSAGTELLFGSLNNAVLTSVVASLPFLRAEVGQALIPESRYLARFFSCLELIEVIIRICTFYLSRRPLQSNSYSYLSADRLLKRLHKKPLAFSNGAYVDDGVIRGDTRFRL